MTPARKEPDKNTYAGRFAIRLRTLREKAGLTPAELAEILGVKSEQTIYDWESSKTQPKITMIPEIAAAFGVAPRTVIPEK